MGTITGAISRNLAPSTRDPLTVSSPIPMSYIFFLLLSEGRNVGMSVGGSGVIGGLGTIRALEREGIVDNWTSCVIALLPAVVGRETGETTRTASSD
jgi:hypothetical protein